MPKPGSKVPAARPRFRFGSARWRLALVGLGVLAPLCVVMVRFANAERDAALSNAGVEIALAIGLAVLAGRAGSEFFVFRPLRRLTATARALEAGDLAARPPLTGGGEIGELARAFSRMAQAVEDRDAHLKQTEARLRDGEKLFRLIAENATDIIARIDLAGTILYASPSVRAILGYLPEEMIGTGIADHIHRDDVAPTLRSFSHLLATGSLGGRKIEYRVEHKNGSWVWLEANPTLVVDAAGKPLEFFDVVRDISERKRSEAEVAEAHRRAEKAAAAQGQFLATMSHELRTPLNSIHGFTGLVLDRADLPPEVRRYIQLVQTASSSLLMVVNDVLDFSRIEEGKLDLAAARFRLAGLVEDSVSIVEDSASRKRLEMSVQIARRAPAHLIGDEKRLRQVLLNLLNNAIKFTRVGHVSLSVSHEGSSEEGERLRFTVADSGIGIAADKLERLFQRFSQADGSTNREFGGSGLGLAICKRLVEMMGGEIGVSSRFGVGSAFWFVVTLPAAAGLDAKPVMELDPGRGVKRARILLAEDVAVNQEIVQTILEAAGHEVDLVPDGADAVMAVEATAYDIVLMDIQMPGMDGVEATKHIRALSGDAGRVPIIAMTANVLPEQVAGFKAAGMNHHIGKPFKREDLILAIERCLGEPAALEEADDPGGDESLDRTLDVERLEELAALVGSEKVERLLAALAGELDGLLRGDTASAEARAGLTREAHRLISCAGMLGFLSLSGTCARLEAALENDDQDVDACLAEVRQAATVMAEIRARMPAKADLSKSA